MYLKPGVYFTLTAYCSLDAKFPSEVFDLDFIKFTIGKVESYFSILKIFLITGSILVLKFIKNPYFSHSSHILNTQ